VAVPEIELSTGVAALLAGAEYRVEDLGGGFQLIVQLATKNVAEIRYSWQASDGSSEPTLQFDERADGSASLHLEFWTETSPLVATNPPFRSGHLLSIGASGLRSPVTAAANGDSGWDVEVDAVVGEFGKDGWTALEEGLGLDSGGAVTEGVYSVRAVFDALGISERFNEMMARLRAARDCLDQQPLTQSSDDLVRHREIAEEIESDLRGNILVEFIAAATSQAANLVTGLGYVVAPGTARAVADLAELNEERLSELEKIAPKCDQLAYFWGEYSLLDALGSTAPLMVVACGKDPGESGWVVASGLNWQSGEYPKETQALIDFIDLWPLSDTRGPAWVWRVHPGEWGEVVHEHSLEIFIEYVAGPPARAHVLIQIPDWVPPYPNGGPKGGDEIMNQDFPLARLSVGSRLPEMCGA
jgi:hypothetical protein